MGSKIRNVNGVTLHCAICLNQGQKVQATTLVKGYASCEDHVPLVSRPGFDIFEVFGGKQGAV